MGDWEPCTQGKHPNRQNMQKLRNIKELFTYCHQRKFNATHRGIWISGYNPDYLTPSGCCLLETLDSNTI